MQTQVHLALWSPAGDSGWHTPLYAPQLRVRVTNEEGKQVLAQALTLTYMSLKP